MSRFFSRKSADPGGVTAVVPSREGEAVALGMSTERIRDDRILYHRKALEEGPVLPQSYFLLENFAKGRNGLSEFLMALSKGKNIPKNDDIIRSLDYVKMPSLGGLIQVQKSARITNNFKRQREISALIESWNLAIEMAKDFLRQFNYDDRIQRLVTELGKIPSALASDGVSKVSSVGPEEVAHEIFLGEDADAHRYYLQGREVLAGRTGVPTTAAAKSQLRSVLANKSWLNILRALKALIQGSETSRQGTLQGLMANGPAALEFYYELSLIFQDISSKRGRRNYVPVGQIHPQGDVDQQFTSKGKVSFKGDEEPDLQNIEETYSRTVSQAATGQEYGQVYEKPTAEQLKKARKYDQSAGDVRRLDEESIDIVLQDVSHRSDISFKEVQETAQTAPRPSGSTGLAPEESVKIFHYGASSMRGGGRATTSSVSHASADWEDASLETDTLERSTESYDPMATSNQPGSSMKGQAEHYHTGIHSTSSYDQGEQLPISKEELSSYKHQLQNSISKLKTNSPQSVNIVVTVLNILINLVNLLDMTSGSSGAFRTRDLPSELQDPLVSLRIFFDRMISNPRALDNFSESTRVLVNTFTAEGWDWKDYLFAQLVFLRDSVVRKNEYLQTKEWDRRATLLVTKLYQLEFDEPRQALHDWLGTVYELVNAGVLQNPFLEKWSRIWKDQLNVLVHEFLQVDAANRLPELPSKIPSNPKDVLSGLISLSQWASYLVVHFPRKMLSVSKELPMLLVPFWLRQLADVPLPRLFVQGRHLSYYLDNMKLELPRGIDTWNWRFISIQDWHNRSSVGVENRSLSRAYTRRRKGHEEWNQWRNLQHYYARKRRTTVTTVAGDDIDDGSRMGRRSRRHHAASIYPWFNGLKTPHHYHGRRERRYSGSSGESSYERSRFDSSSEYAEPYETVSENVHRKPMPPRSHRLSESYDDAFRRSSEDLHSQAPRHTDQRYLLSCSGMSFLMKDVVFSYLLKSKWLFGLSHQEMMDEGVLDIMLGGGQATSFGRPKSGGGLFGRRNGASEDEWTPAVIARRSVVGQRTPGVSFFVELGTPPRRKKHTMRSHSSSTSASRTEDRYYGDESVSSLLQLYGVRVIIDQIDINIHDQYYGSWMYKAIFPMLKKQLKKAIEESVEEYIVLAVQTTDQWLSLLKNLTIGPSGN